MKKGGQKIIPVASKHIQAGIQKYKGVVDKNLQQQLTLADCPYLPYRFSDGRYLLVHEATSFAFLYPNVASVYEKLVLD